MANDTKYRSYQPADQRWPAKATPASGGHDGGQDRSDPLAELARLIGQTDPFGDLNKVSPPREVAAVRPPPMMAPAPMYQPPAPSVAPDPYGSPLQYSEKSFAAPSRAEPAQESFQPAYDPTIYGMPQQQVPGYPPEPHHGEDERLPHGHESYEEDDSEESPRRWPRYAMAAGVVLLLGTGGVFGYRAMFPGSSSGSVPPVIKASTTPTKVAAAPGANSKQINDRVSEPSQGERIVSREEKPLDVKDASRSVAPTRTVFPSLPGAGNSGPPDSVMASGSPSLNTDPVGASAAEPKKIRTVAIVPDPNTGAPTTRQAPAPRAATNASAPMPLAPTAPVRSATNAPLSLSPQVANAEASAPRPAPPPAQAVARPAAPTRVAALPTAPAADAPSGSYSVQISSQRSEAEAQSSFRSLQGKFPSLLGDRQPIIRRADLGDKGIYFRSMVGGFGSQDQATQFCGSLKAAGGQCVVQRN